jgi:membrane-associated protease RseP (regulator of RpoE activity)
MSWALAIAVLALLVFVHELGHFVAARAQGIRVDRFSIGFGPVLWKYQGAETEYAIRAFPLGGYVGFPDDDPEGHIPLHDPDLMRNRPILDRAIVIGAGVFANFLFAYLCLCLMVVTVGAGTVDSPGVRITQILSPTAPAMVAGLHTQDVVLSARYGDKVVDFGRSPTVLEDFRQFISQHPEQTIELTVQRDQRLITIPVTPANEGGVGKIGVALDFAAHPYRHPVRDWSALAVAAQEFEQLASITLQGLHQLITDFQNAAGQLSGPVAIVAIGSELVKSDMASLFDFTAVVSINLAFINLLPLPALDGGQLLFLLIEALRGGKPVPARWQEGVMQGGLFLLLGLGALMIVKDSYNLFWQNLL